MNNSEFRKTYELADWMYWLHENIHRYPVKPDIKPGDINPGCLQKHQFEESFETFSVISKILFFRNDSLAASWIFAYFPYRCKRAVNTCWDAFFCARCSAWYGFSFGRRTRREDDGMASGYDRITGQFHWCDSGQQFISNSGFASYCKRIQDWFSDK